MSLKSVWGFDPDEIARARQAIVKSAEAEGPLEPLTAECAEVSQRIAARIPEFLDAQLYELRRLFRL